MAAQPRDLVRYTLVDEHIAGLSSGPRTARSVPDGLVQVAANNGTVADGGRLERPDDVGLASLAAAARLSGATGRIANPVEDRRELINQALSASDALAVDSDDPDTRLRVTRPASPCSRRPWWSKRPTNRSATQTMSLAPATGFGSAQVARSGRAWWSQTSSPTASAS